MTSVDLTVIVPVYNEVATIAPLLDAVLAAPYVKQVIVVDDGSTDGTAAVTGLAGGPSQDGRSSWSLTRPTAARGPPSARPWPARRGASS